MSTSLTELLRLAANEAVSDIHTTMPARIESYDHTQQRASVQPLIKKQYRDGQEVSMPIIDRVPVVFPRSGGASLTFPVKAGDNVLLVFSERSMEKWLQDGGEQNPEDPRKFDLTDAIALPGLNPFNLASASTTNKDVELVYNGFRLVVNDDNRFAIGNAQEELLTLLTELLMTLTEDICIPFSHLLFHQKYLELATRLQLIRGNLNPSIGA